MPARAAQAPLKAVAGQQRAAGAVQSLTMSTQAIRDGEITALQWACFFDAEDFGRRAFPCGLFSVLPVNLNRRSDTRRQLPEKRALRALPFVRHSI